MAAINSCGVYEAKASGNYPAVYHFARNRQEMMNEAKDSLVKAQLRMKKQADKGRRPLEFTVGDMVMLKLTPRLWKKIYRNNRH